MNRRSFLQSAAALSLSALVPTWFKWPEVAQPINLQAFCAAEPFRKFDATRPFVQMDVDEARAFTFATDGKIAVRVNANAGLLASPDGKFPPCAGLRWWPDEGTDAWRPWPKANYLLASDSDCPRCDGYGVYPNQGECEACYGLGNLEDADFWSRVPNHQCRACRGSGNAGPICTHCHGKAIGVFPAIQPIESCQASVYLDAKIDRKMRRELRNIEYRVIDAYNVVPIQFRFDGGHGLVMVIDRHFAEKRILEAKR